jgi:hypothetical protein
VKKEFIVERQGRSFVLYAGLLDLAHSQGLKSIETKLVQVPSEANNRVAICTAVVVMEKDGVERSFSGVGDAAPNNVAPAMALCLIRMSETRAKARALRDAVNIGVAAFEELGEEDAYDGAPERGYELPAPRPVRQPTRQATTRSQAPVRSAPVAAQPTDPITEDQLNAVRNLCRRSGVEADQMAAEQFGVEGLAQITTAQAGELIRTLSSRRTVGAR